MINDAHRVVFIDQVAVNNMIPNHSFDYQGVLMQGVDASSILLAEGYQIGRVGLLVDRVNTIVHIFAFLARCFASIFLNRVPGVSFVVGSSVTVLIAD